MSSSIVIGGQVAVAIVLIFLVLRNGRKIDGQLATENRTLKAVNDRLVARVQKLELTDKEHTEDIEHLQKQMLQVHDWLGQVTFSDFLENAEGLRARVAENEEQRRRRLDRTTQQY